MRYWITLVTESSDQFDDDDLIYGPSGELTLYHFSQEKFDHFKPFSHFGTKEAAMSRSGGRHGFLYEIKVRVKCSVIIEDGGSNHTIEGIMEYLETALQLDLSMVDGILTSARNNDFEDALDFFDEQRITALAYHNNVEDAGSTSFVIPNPHKINIISVSQI